MNSRFLPESWKSAKNSKFALIHYCKTIRPLLPWKYNAWKITTDTCQLFLSSMFPIQWAPLLILKFCFKYSFFFLLQRRWRPFDVSDETRFNIIFVESLQKSSPCEQSSSLYDCMCVVARVAVIQIWASILNANKPTTRMTPEWRKRLCACMLKTMPKWNLCSQGSIFIVCTIRVTKMCNSSTVRQWCAISSNQRETQSSACDFSTL